jgi:hypothetical protein
MAVDKKPLIFYIVFVTFISQLSINVSNNETRSCERLSRQQGKMGVPNKNGRKRLFLGCDPVKFCSCVLMFQGDMMSVVIAGEKM